MTAHDAHLWRFGSHKVSKACNSTRKNNSLDQNAGGRNDRSLLLKRPNFSWRRLKLHYQYVFSCSSIILRIWSIFTHKVSILRSSWRKIFKFWIGKYDSYTDLTPPDFSACIVKNKEYGSSIQKLMQTKRITIRKVRILRLEIL